MDNSVDNFRQKTLDKSPPICYYIVTGRATLHSIGAQAVRLSGMGKVVASARALFLCAFAELVITNRRARPYVHIGRLAGLSLPKRARRWLSSTILIIA